MPTATQEHLPIAGIQDDVILMADGSLRLVLKAEPINFDLKSEEEQTAIIYAYQGFLNSLEFPIQIVMQSKRLDLQQYLNRTEAAGKEVSNELLRLQLADYVDFVRHLISVANIMAKRFYIVVGHSNLSPGGLFSGLTSMLGRKQTGPVIDQDSFDRMHQEIFSKAQITANGLARLGVQSRLLSTQELIELFYAAYNPDVAAEQRLTNVSALNSGIITAPLLTMYQEEEEAPATPPASTTPEETTPPTNEGGAV
jgi:type IV secretory pathway VirB4 component